MIMDENIMKGLTGVLDKIFKILSKITPELIKGVTELISSVAELLGLKNINSLKLYFSSLEGNKSKRMMTNHPRKTIN